MASSRSLGVLTLDLILKLGGFKQGADQAERETQKVTDSLDKLKRAGAALAKSTASPFEKLQADLARYDELLKAGAITQETYNRAVLEAGASFAALDPAMQATNALMAEGAKITASVVSPTEAYEATVKQLDTLLAAEAISQETYNRALLEAKATLAGTNAAEQAHNAAMAEGAALTRSLLSPQEQLTASLKRYDELLEASAIDQETYNRAVAKAKTTYANAGKGAAGAGQGASSALGAFASLNRMLLGFGVGFSAVAVIEGLKAAATEAIEFADQIGKLEQTTGIAGSELTELAGVAELLDVDLDTLAKGFKGLQLSISEAASGNKAALATFDALSINVDELADMDLADAFELVADRIHALDNEADQARATTELFKKAGIALLPAFAQGAEGLRAAREEVERLGGAMTDADLKKLQEADDAIDAMSLAWHGFARSITAAAAPAITTFFQKWADGLSDSNVPIEELQRRVDSIQNALDHPLIFGLDTKEAEAEIAELQKRIAATKDQLAKAAREVNLAAVSRGGGGEVLTPKVKGFGDGDGTKPKTGKSPAEQAREDLEKLIRTMTDSQAVLGATDAATLRYSISTGELARQLELLGKAAGPLRAKLLNLVDQQATNSIEEQIRKLELHTATMGMNEAEALRYSITQGELKKALDDTGKSQSDLTARLETAAVEDTAAAVEQQIIALEDQAATYGMTAQAALEYSLTQGELSRTLKLTGEAQEGLTQRFRDAQATLEGKQVYEATRTEAEKYAAELKRLADLLASGKLQGGQDTYNRAVTDSVLAHIEATDAAEEYRLEIAELQRLLSLGVGAGGIDQGAFDAAAAKAKENFDKAGAEAGKVFADEFKRNSVGILGDFLENAVKGDFDFDDLLADFNDMLIKMSAQAVAAKIMEKIFAPPTGLPGATGGGGGFLDWIKGLFGGIASGGAAGGGGGVINMLKSLFMGEGGKLAPGRVAIAGEAGRELVVGDGAPARLGKLMRGLTSSRAPLSPLPGHVAMVGEAGRAQVIQGGAGGATVVPLDRGTVEVHRALAAVFGTTPARLVPFARDDELDEVLERLTVGVTSSAVSFDMHRALSKLFSGFMADGGTVAPGHFAVAGEAGRELVFGGTSGATVVPFKRGGDTINNNVSVNVQTKDGSALSRAAAAQFTAATARAIQIANARNN